MKVLFRASGGRAKNKELGMGHIFRCLNLASELKKQDTFFLIEDYGGLKKFFRDRKIINLNYLKKNLSSKNELKKILEIIKKNEIDVIIVDRYGVDPNYISLLRKNITTIIISDLKNIEYNADLVVNGFIGFKNQISYNKFKARCLLGPKYQILNPNFKKKIPKKKNYEILATFGGYDENKVIEKIIHVLNNRSEKIRTKIILGPVKEKTPILKEFIKKNYSWLKIIDETKNMKNESSKTKFGLCSGGLTTYEMAAMKIPFGIICQNDHQVITAKKWQRLGYGIDLGMATNFSEKKFEMFLKKIQLLKNKEQVVDGKGTLRVINEIKKIHKKNHN